GDHARGQPGGRERCTPPREPRGRRAVRRRAIALGAAGLLAAGAAAGGAVAAWDRALAGAGAEEPPASSAPAVTATVERRDLVTREEFDGTLGYTDSRAVGSRRQG